MTARTRSASRSNPQRMSVASLAIQIRAPCARSIACKLGSPIILWPLPKPATPAPGQRRILVPPLSSDHSAVGFPRVGRLCYSACSLPALPRKAPEGLPAIAFSGQKNTRCANCARDKTRPHSVRYAPVLGSTSATSPASALYVASSRNTATLGNLWQDGVRLTLTSKTYHSSYPAHCSAVTASIRPSSDKVIWGL